MSKRKNLIQRLQMPLAELERYYREQRKECFEKNESFSYVKLRKMLHPILLCGLKILHLFCGQKITVIGDQRVLVDRPIIFAALTNHLRDAMATLKWEIVLSAERYHHSGRCFCLYG